MSVVLYHDYAYFAIKQISSFSSSCKSVKHRLHFSEVACSHGKGGDLRSKYSPDLDCEKPLTMCAGCPAQWDGQPCLPHNAIVSFQNLIRRMHFQTGHDMYWTLAGKRPAAYVHLPNCTFSCFYKIKIHLFYVDVPPFHCGGGYRDG